MAVGVLGTRSQVDRSHQQRIDALNRANVVRLHRARVKRDMKAGRVGLRSILTSEEPNFETWGILDVLLNLPKVGRVKAKAVLTAEHISPSRPLGKLTGREVDALLARMQ